MFDDDDDNVVVVVGDCAADNDVDDVDAFGRTPRAATCTMLLLLTIVDGLARLPRFVAVRSFFSLLLLLPLPLLLVS